MPFAVVATAEIQGQIKAFDSETSTLETMMVEAKTSVLNLPKQWTASDTAQKQELQRALFPDGLMVSKEKGYFERGNTSLMESWRLFFNSLEGSTSTESFEKMVGPRGRFSNSRRWLRNSGFKSRF
jgi:hypothetical protein